MNIGCWIVAHNLQHNHTLHSHILIHTPKSKRGKWFRPGHVRTNDKTIILCKLLSVFIDDQLTFDKHVSKVQCMCAGRQTNTLRTIVKYLTPGCKFIMYTACIASNFNYCNVIWPLCGHTNSLKIAKLHKRSLNVVLNDHLSPYHVRLWEVKRPAMYVSRMKSIIFEVFTCFHNYSPSYITDMFRNFATRYDTRGGT